MRLLTRVGILVLNILTIVAFILNFDLIGYVCFALGSITLLFAYDDKDKVIIPGEYKGYSMVGTFKGHCFYSNVEVVDQESSSVFFKDMVAAVTFEPELRVRCKPGVSLFILDSKGKQVWPGTGK